MPTWLLAALEMVGPITAVEPAVVAFGNAVATELKAGDSIGSKALEIGKALVDFAKDIEHAVVAHTEAAPGAGAAAQQTQEPA